LTELYSSYCIFREKKEKRQYFFHLLPSEMEQRERNISAGGEKGRGSLDRKASIDAFSPLGGRRKD